MFIFAEYRCEVCEQQISLTDKAEWVPNGGLLCEHCYGRYLITLHAMAHKHDPPDEAGG